ncbi:hypothetical protein PRIPAC_70670, partial [Pristionchus pacificus]|uniref:TIL domain-containing protein n=1 Tax=Pristionchus pacificus TaxID=54126 RepID=A0A2A6CSM6_PRIPA
RDSISTLPSLPVSPPPPFLPSIMLSILVYYVLSAEELSSNISDSSSSLLFQSMNESFNSTAFYHSSYRGDAIRNSLLLHIGYLPIYFLAATAYRSSLVRVKYRNTIIFSGVIQFLLTLPYTLFLTWFALFVSEEIETTVLSCTIMRIGLSVLNYASYNALTVPQLNAISVSRLISVVFKHQVGLLCNMIVLFVASFPMIPLFISIFIVGENRDGDPQCGPILFFPEHYTQVLRIWHIYVFAIPLIAVFLNAITAVYLLYQRFNRLAAGSKTKRVNEFYIAFALLMQSIIPALTMTMKGYRSVVTIYALQPPPWVKELVDTTSFLTTGLNMTASMVFIREFFEVVVTHRDERINTGCKFFSIFVLSALIACGSAQNPSCGKNERYNVCGNHCEPKCGQYGGFPCILLCGPPACVCEENFYRHANGHCATKQECSKQ